MSYRKTAPMAACLCLAALPLAVAQTRTTPFSQSLTATSGLSIGQHRDASSSPIPFSGSGIAARVGYERSAGRWTTSLSLDGTQREYTSRADAGTSVRERAYDGALTATVLRTIGGGSAFAAGLAFDVRGGLLTHRYADPLATTTDYVSGYALVGPAVRWQHPLFGGNAIARFSVPVAGVAHHPYTDARIDQAPPSLHAVSPATLRGYDASVGFESSTRRRVGLMAEFQAHTLDYADVQRARTASTSLTAGVIVRFGKTRP